MNNVVKIDYVKNYPISNFEVEVVKQGYLTYRLKPLRRKSFDEYAR